jgi:hypothetical protein
MFVMYFGYMRSPNPASERGDGFNVVSAPAKTVVHFRLSRTRVESGYTTIFQATFYTYILFMFLGIVYDFGGVGYAIAIGSNATRLAAQDAAKNIDVQHYIDEQGIRLNGNAEQSARNLVSGLTGGKVSVISVSIATVQTHNVITVQSRATIDLPILGSLFGLAPITVPFTAYAEPAFGIGQEGQ